ncbi:MAG: acetyl-CoA carboxylase biotin carboxylase subunit family protein [Myxococcota bacterium]
MPLFTKALAEVGARVYGIGDQPLQGLDPDARAAMTDYRQVRHLWDKDAILQEIREWLRGVSIDRIECLWEPGMDVVAHVRQALGLPGLDPERTVAFRDKERMKQVLDAAGIRTPRHERASTAAQCREAAERVGYPAIIKPIAGAGAADTHRLEGPDDLERVLPTLAHVEDVSVEEFIEGEEYTFDTICAGGEVLFHNVSWYRPKPLIMRQNPWISPVSIALRDTSAPDIQIGVDLGHQVIKALGFESGITHMEWFRTPSGEAVFGEIGGRAPGGRIVHAMNHATCGDMFRGWAEAVCYGRLSQDVSKKYNVGVVFKRAEGAGRIQRVEGLESLLRRYGEHVVHVDLVPVGQPRRDYRQVVEGDGWMVVRHPDLESTVEMTNAVATDLRMFAG